MSEHDNKITPDIIHTISIAPPIQSSADYCCIICAGSFTVWPKPAYHGDMNVNQTLFCQNCLKTLKTVMDREERKDFGW